jgi:hypothetical protein
LAVGCAIKVTFSTLFRALDPRAPQLRTGAVQLIAWMRCKQIEIHLVLTERLVNVFAFLGCELVVVVKCSRDVQIFVGAIGSKGMSFLLIIIGN